MSHFSFQIIQKLCFDTSFKSLGVYLLRIDSQSLQPIDYPEGSVGEVGWWVDDTVLQDIRWKKPFLVHEELVTEFLLVIQGKFLFLDKYKWLWKVTWDDTFSVSSAYHSFLAYSNFPNQPPSTCNLSLPHILDSLTHSKVIIFSWKLLLNRPPF